MNIERNFPESVVDIFEHPTGISETIPCQALNIRDIMTKGLSGQQLREIEMNRLDYGDDEDFDDDLPMEFDLTDLDELKEKTAYLGKRLEKYQKDKEKKPSPASEAKQDDGDLPSPTSD